MSSNSERLRFLFERHLQDTGTPKELEEFWKLFRELEQGDPVKEDIWRLWDRLGPEEQLKKKDWNNIDDRLHHEMIEWDKQPPRSLMRRLGRRTAAAAAIILFIGAGFYLVKSGRTSVNVAGAETQSQRLENDITPGSNKAELTIANGRKIILDSAQNGVLVRQGNASVVKQANGELTYESGREDQDKPVVFNTLSTPRGGQYKLILPDGSMVWLNSASSIRFPSAFDRSPREVEITGEAYFEVTHMTASSGAAAKKNIPFIVHANGVTVEVLGTHFNINAYKDESVVKTTLLQGSVSVSKADRHQMLLPGEQACISGDGPIRLVTNPDIHEVMGWKNGYFEFRDDSISTIMRQVARWYDVNIKYEGDIPQLFIGKVPRNLNVSTLCKILESTGWVHFSINGREIVVRP